MIMIDHSILSEELFCDVMISHYQKLLQQRVKGWRFVAAAFAWKKLKYYQRMREEVLQTKSIVDSVLNDVNNGSKVNSPAITLQ